MKKRTIILLIILFFINIFILTSCKEHQHTFDEGRIIQEASCLAEGIKEFKCTECEETKQETINKLVHLYETTIIGSTCKETGLETKVCKLCNDKQEKVLEKLEHTIVIDKTVEATCKNTGLTEGTHCSECGEVIKKQEVISVLEHNYVDGKCSNCDAEDPNYKEEHTHTESQWIILEEATCTKEGKKQKMCTSCDEVLSEETIKKLDHTIVIDKAVEATCRNTGLTEGSHCSVCKEIIKQQKTIDKLEHNYVNGKCSNCDSKDPNYKDENASKGLTFELNEDKKSYSVTGIGTCTDTDVIIPSVYNGLPVTNIGDGAFEWWSNLTSIVIPDSVTNIGDAAFQHCYGLESIEIPNSVTSIGFGAFCCCTNITSINVDANNQYYKSIDGNLYSKDGTKLIQYAIGKKDTSFVIPNSVTSIVDNAFGCCESLENMTIPKGVTSIGSYAFFDCESLTSIVIPDSVTSIGDYAFTGCESLTSIVIPDSVTSIGDYAFSYCERLTNIEIPNSVTSIGDYAFTECNNLTSINVDINNQYYKSIDGNLYSKDGTKLIQYAIGKKDTSFVIPNSVTSIVDNAFRCCESLENMTIPKGVTSIGSYAFIGCESLTSIVIPDSVTSIGDYAFSYCERLTIYCETKEKPSGWSYNWNSYDRPIVWGYENK